MQVTLERAFSPEQRKAWKIKTAGCDMSGFDCQAEQFELFHGDGQQRKVLEQKTGKDSGSDSNASSH